MRATYSPLTCGMHHISLRHGLRSFSARRRRTVSRDMLSCSVSLTIAPANSSSVQRARPSGALEQAVATRRASSLPESLRPAPGRGSSLSAPSRLPSTKRRLVRYTVEPPTPTLVAMSSSLVPASAAIDESQTQCVELCDAPHRTLRHRHAQAPHEPVCARMQEQPQLVSRSLRA